MCFEVFILHAWISKTTCKLDCPALNTQSRSISFSIPTMGVVSTQMAWKITPGLGNMRRPYLNVLCNQEKTVSSP